MTERAPGLSPIQAAVQIVQNMIQCGMQPITYAQQMEDLHALTAEWALGQIRAEYEQHMREVDPDYVLTLAEVTNEANENTPMAEAYWAATSAFFRKVYQACAAAA